MNLKQLRIENDYTYSAVSDGDVSFLSVSHGLISHTPPRRLS